MQNQWAPLAFFAGALFLGPAAAEAQEEQISAKLLEEAKAKVVDIERLISAAKEGDAKAQFDLGTMIAQDGPHYVRKNMSRENRERYYTAHREIGAAALVLFLRSARQGHLPAVWRVPDLFRTRSSIHKGCLTTQTKYLVQALAWDRVLFRMTGEEVVEYHNDIEYIRRELLEGRLTDDQVAEAKRMSREIEREIKQNTSR